MPAYPESVTEEIASGLRGMPAGSPAAAVARRLLELFTGGTIEPGTRLPPERQLAANLEVGRSAVREALAALEVLGIVDVRPGSGTYLRGTVSELLPQTLAWGALVGQHATAELVEIRGALEVLAARLAAERIGEDGLARLRKHVAAMRERVGRSPGFIEADLRFHDEVALASGNALLRDQLSTLRSLLRVWVDRAVSEEQPMLTAVAEHAQVLDAIAARDPEAAAAALAAHMATAGTRLLRATPPAS